MQSLTVTLILMSSQTYPSACLVTSSILVLLKCSDFNCGSKNEAVFIKMASHVFDLNPL